MKLKTVSCTQFAGIRERRIAFEDGINVIYGQNESGKSTLVHLISRVLFQSVHLHKRLDKDFFDRYFPGTRKGGVTGDFIDGTVSFEAADKTYTLTKEWGDDARCQLSTPDGVFRDQDTVNALLKEALGYGEGVYADLLFSSQRNTDQALQTLLDASGKTDAKQDIADAVSMAFAQSDGISVDAIERAIQTKIEDLMGKHWDIERDAPMRKAGGGRHQKQCGDVLKAYYALEDATAVLDDIARLETEVERTADAFAKADAAAEEARALFEAFQGLAGQLALRAERRKAAERLRAEQQKYNAVLADWPGRLDKLTRAKALQTEQQQRRLLDTYETAQTLSAALADANAAADKPSPTREELACVNTALREIRALNNALGGMHLTAAVTMLNGHELTIYSLRTGERLPLTDGNAAISEAVRLTVDGVMELCLAPADIDAADAKARLAAQQTVIDNTLARYGVQTPEALEQLAQTAAVAALERDRLRDRLKATLGDTSLENIQREAEAIDGEVRQAEVIAQDIRTLCGDADLTRTVMTDETVLEGYTRDYGSIRDLKARAFDTAQELQETLAHTEDTDLPEDVAHIPDPEAHLRALQESLRLCRERRETALTDKTTAAGRLETYKETVAGDPAAEADKARRFFEEQQALLRHWLHIAQVFEAQKAAVADRPMQDIADRFLHYCTTLSDGTLESDFPEADKLRLQIYSHDRLLDYDKLSEGTKETVSLAFRLAVLDHLFPEGGVIVLDDPLTDMDAARTARACAMLKECATRHQVIFLTCKEAYHAALDGHLIRV